MDADPTPLVDILSDTQMTVLKSESLDSNQSYREIILDSENLNRIKLLTFSLSDHSSLTQIFQTEDGWASNSLSCYAATVMLQTLTGQAHE